MSVARWKSKSLQAKKFVAFLNLAYFFRMLERIAGRNLIRKIQLIKLSSRLKKGKMIKDGL